MKIDVLIALIVCIGAAILICILFLGILLQQRRQVRRERNRHKRNRNDQKKNNKSSSPNHDEFYQYGDDDDTADAEVAPPPPIRMVVVTTSTSSSSSAPSGKHDATITTNNQTRPGLEKSISERSGVDVWQLRQDDRKEYILEHILYKKVTHSLLFGTLQLPHLDDLSLRGRERGRSNIIVFSNSGEEATSNHNEAHDETSFSRQAHNDDKKNNKHYNNIRYNTTDMTSSIGGGTVMTPISMTSEESHPVSSSIQQLQPQQEHQHQYSHWACPICMEPYESGDMICWSRNENCPHAFHLECKVGYLLNTDECILCRNNFLNHPHQEEQGLVVEEEEKEKNVMGMGQV